MLALRAIEPVPRGRSPAPRPTHAFDRSKHHSSTVDDYSGRPLLTAQRDLGSPVHYLPPLLSLLPGQTRSAQPIAAFDSSIATAQVGFTDSNLPYLDDTSRLLHAALHHFRPVGREYVKRPYEAAFNWSELDLPIDLEAEWCVAEKDGNSDAHRYAVAFRSRRNRHANSAELYRADRDAHEEAVRQGGLICYLFGVPDDDGFNLATCIWSSRGHALVANAGPKHIVAMKLARRMYADFTLERYTLRKHRGIAGISVSPFQLAAPASAVSLNHL